MNSKRLYERRNTDNIFVRSVIGGLLNMLNNEIRYEQVWSPDAIDELFVPFFYDMGSSGEDFIQDNYTFFEDVCEFPEKKIDGNFDIIPRAHVKMDDISIRSGDATNRFVMGEYTKVNEECKQETYVSFLYSMPLTVSFSVEVRIDNVINMFKIEQALREFFYKNKTFYTTFKGMRIGCRAGFPDNFKGEKTMEYSIGSAEAGAIYNKRVFTIDVETYHPIFDPTTEILKTNKLKSFAYDVTFNLNDKDNRNVGAINKEDGSRYIPIISTDVATNTTGKIIVLSNLKDSTLSSRIPVMLKWNSFKGNGDMRTIRLSYVDNETGEKEEIKVVYNTSYYYWDLPKKFKDNALDFNITYLSGNVYTKPEIEIIPDTETGEITIDSFKIKNKGYFMSDDPNASIDVTIDYLNEKTDAIETLKGVKINLFNNQIDEENPVTITRKLVYKNPIKYNNINIIIEDAIDSSCSSVIENVSIV